MAATPNLPRPITVTDAHLAAILAELTRLNAVVGQLVEVLRVSSAGPPAQPAPKRR